MAGNRRKTQQEHLTFLCVCAVGVFGSEHQMPRKKKLSYTDSKKNGQPFWNVTGQTTLTESSQTEGETGLGLSQTPFGRSVYHSFFAGADKTLVTGGASERKETARTRPF